MAANLVQCPRCGQVLSVDPTVAAGILTCGACGQPFQLAPGPIQPFGAGPPAGPIGFGPNPASPGSYQWPQEPAPSPALDMPQWPHPRRSRIAASDYLLLTIGIPIAAIGLLILLILLPWLEVARGGLTLIVTLATLAGAGTAVYALRSKILVAIPAAGVLLALVVVGFAVQEAPKSPDELADTMFNQMGEMVQLAESIRDEASLNQAGQKVAELYEGIWKAHRRLDASLDKVAAEKRERLELAKKEFHSRMQAVAPRLAEVSGGPELARRLARIAPQPAVPPPPVKKEPGEIAKQFSVLSSHLSRYEVFEERAPNGWGDLEQNANQRDPGSIPELKQLQKAEIIVIWGVSDEETGQFDDGFIAAYEKDAPQRGGVVLIKTPMLSQFLVLAAEEIQESLNRQAAAVEAKTGVPQPRFPGMKIAGDSLTDWIPWGWRSEFSPPESDSIRERRNKRLEAMDRRPDSVEIYLDEHETIPTANRAHERLQQASGEFSILFKHWDRDKGWVFTCGGVKDMRRLVFKLDIGPVQSFDETAGVVRIRADKNRLWLPPPEQVAASVWPPAAQPESPPQLPSPPPVAPKQQETPRIADSKKQQDNPFKPAPEFAEPVKPAEDDKPAQVASTPSLPAESAARPETASPPMPFGPRRFGPSGFGPPGFGPGDSTPPPTALGSQEVGRKGELLGGAGGVPFFSARAGAPVVGFLWSSGTWAGKKGLGRLRPLYDRRLNTGSTIVAREGYAVAALEVDADQYVFAVRVVFARLKDDGSVDAADTYTSDWIGHPSGGSVRKLDGAGAKIIGIYGRGTAMVDAVGLVLE